MIVGIIEGKENIISLPFKKAGNHILIVGDTKVELGGSEYHSVIYDLEGGKPPKINEQKIKATWDFLLELYGNDLIKANHDVNKGGFIITIAEMCFKNGLGANLDLKEYDIEGLRDDELLFSESVGRFIIETAPKDLDMILKTANKHNIRVTKIGDITNNTEIIVKGLKGNNVELNLNKLKNLYDSTIPNLMEI
jgi:phosphoribosylformylglycinamidine synthase